MKKIFTILFSLLAIVFSLAQTIYSENFGTAGPTTTPYPTVTTYTGYQNATPISYNGTATLRSSSVSSAYTGASGGTNVFFAASGGQTFIVKGINTSAYNTSGLQLSFGWTTSPATAIITVETSVDDGANWTAITVPANTSTAWTLKTITSGIPSASNLSLRFTAPVTTLGMRIDDVKITFVSANCKLVPGSPTSSCDATTLAMDTYTAKIPFTGGGSATYSITTTAGTVAGDNPTSIASGNILINGVTEGTDITVTITGGDCSFSIPVTASSCKPINTLPFTDSFNYTSGTNLSTQQSWRSANSGDEIQIATGGPSYTGISSSGNSITFAGAGAEAYAPFTNVTSGFISQSFVFSVSDLAAVTDGASTYFSVFTAQDGNNTAARIWIKKTGSQYQFGLSPSTAATDVVWSPNLYDSGSVQYLKMSYDFATNTLYLFENQIASPLTPSVKVTMGTAITTIGGIMFRQDSNTTTPGIIIDELNVNNDAIVLGVSDINNAKTKFIKNTIVHDSIEFTAKANVKLYNANGQLVRSAKVNEGSALNVSSLSKGVYIVVGEVDGQNVSQKIIKK